MVTVMSPSVQKVLRCSFNLNYCGGGLWSHKVQDTFTLTATKIEKTNRIAERGKQNKAECSNQVPT